MVSDERAAGSSFKQQLRIRYGKMLEMLLDTDGQEDVSYEASKTSY